MTSHPYFALTDITLRPCGMCAAGKCERCIGLSFNSTSEPCPCREAGHLDPAAEETPAPDVVVPGNVSEADGVGAPDAPRLQVDLSPGSVEWTKRITASKVAAILGVSPWDSPRSVWHEMRGDVQRPASNESQRRGHYLEPAILAWWRDQHGVEVSESSRDLWIEQPLYTLGEWAAATPDAESEVYDGDDRATCLVEAKSAASDDDWGDPGTDEIPTYYLTQCYWQMHVSGVRRCYVPVLTSRLRFVEYVVDYDEEIGDDLEQRMRAFYDSLSAHEPPALDDSVATFDVIKRLHKDIALDRSVELTEPQAAELVEWHAQSKQAEAPLRAAKSAVMEAMGNARYATYNGRRIARRQADGPDRTKFVVVGKPADLQSFEESA